MSETFSKGRSKLAIIGGVLIALLLFMSIMVYSSKVYASEDYWEIKAGKETVAIVDSESSAKNVVEGIKQAYVKKDAKVDSITMDKDLVVEQKRVRADEAPKAVDAKNAITKILNGKAAKVEYTIKDGDTAWEIAQEKGLLYEKLVDMNKSLDLEGLLPGDKIVISEAKPYVNVTTVQEVNSEQTIEPEVQYIETSDLYEGEERVKEEGVTGSKNVLSKETTVNGEISKNEPLKEKVTKEATPRVILKGTKPVPKASSGATGSSSSRPAARAVSYSGGSGSGSAVVSFANQFIGNPYVYGGGSLTNGCDCVGFVVGVYNAMGYGIPRTLSFAGVGRSVSPSEMQPGDVLCYAGHVSIYAGGGTEVHALNPSLGIRRTPLGWANAGPILAVKRIV